MSDDKTTLKDPGPYMASTTSDAYMLEPVRYFTTMKVDRPYESVPLPIARMKADMELEFTRAKLFWAKYGHPALYAVTAAVSAYIGHQL